VLYPFLILVVVFWLAIFVGRRRGNLSTMREVMDRYAVLCRRIAAERIRLEGLTGAEHAQTLARIEELEQARQKAEQRAVRLHEKLQKAGFAVQNAQLMTVADAEAELRARVAEGSA
jgi:hypothetical protein